MSDKEFIDVIERFKNGLISRGTGGNFEDADYKSDRDIILKNPRVKDVIPSYVRSCRTPNEFWNFIQPKYARYADRRKFISDSMNEVLALIEAKTELSTPVSNMDAYELGVRLGSGGFGEVYRFHHKLLDCDFAIKIFNPIYANDAENKESEERFFREAKILFSLDHKNIVKIYDIGRIDQKPFIRMELVEGYNMNEFVAKHSIVNFERSKKPILALLEGLKYAHSKGVIHRDLKPSNYMVTENREFKIIDFGISAFLETEGHTKLTKTGEHIAGGLYTDPHLMQNPKLRDPRSDIYSVGAIWYFLLTGKAPSGSDMKNFLMISTEITTLQADIVMKCLSQDINDRYLSCDDLIQRLNPPIATNDKGIESKPNQYITEVTREYIIEYLTEFYNEQMNTYVYHVPSQNSDYGAVFCYNGRKTEIDFLNRLYKLSEMPSHGGRFSNFEDEIYHHTIGNDDFKMFWIFDDERLMLKNGNDEVLLRFLSEMFHPAIRKERSDWSTVLNSINELLNADGYEIYENTKISNRAVYSYRFKI